VDRRKRAPNLTSADIGAIVKIIDGWTGELTWQALIDRIEIVRHACYSRQSLAKHGRIQQAFSNYIEREENKSTRRPEVDLLKDRISRLEAEISRLEAENNCLLEQFARWAYRASQKNLDLNYLNQPLPKIDRGGKVK
jgi:polyhydroxyalkanoate synthesis regulator phasin